MTASDIFGQQTADSIGVGSRAIEPSDTATLSPIPRRLRVTGAGTVRFRGIDGEIDTWTCTDFDAIPIAVDMVYADGTTATNPSIVDVRKKLGL